MNFPNIDPVIIHIYGPIAIRWYGIAYLAGVMAGLYNLGKLSVINNIKLADKAKEDLVIYLILGIIAGGRLGYILFYGLETYLSNPIEIFYIWQGGMSFHGGCVGLALSCYVFCKKHHIPIVSFADLICCSAPIGIFFGRIANFINAELYGRVTSSKFGMVFPSGGDLPRHASQIYEALLEGLLLFIILNYRARKHGDLQKSGKLTGLFLLLYAIFRIICEFFREPDVQIGIIYMGVTMGQILSIPMIILGIYLLCRKN